ncbi:MAG: hypothetical protein KGL19_13800, partial [Bacteroidota bacterium]|nr:hypothetical protein [Bacteroidota bacterium]
SAFLLKKQPIYPEKKTFYPNKLNTNNCYINLMKLKNSICNLMMLRKLILLHLVFFIFYNSSLGQCYTQLTGQGLYLFSPLKNKVTNYKIVHGRDWGDSTLSKCPSYGPVYWKRVAPAYIVERGTAIYAAHSGILRVFTSGGSPESNDACWIDAGNMSTAYFFLYCSVATNQYVYAGQRIGTVMPRSDTAFIYFSIRMSKPMTPTMARASIPAAGDKNCMCYIDPVWPEYFVNPAEWRIYWYYNDSEPRTKISVNISPSWVGKWSFDNGQTWLNSGETVTGLPQKYYKIIFNERAKWKTPLPIEIEATDTKSDFDLLATYENENMSSDTAKKNMIDSAVFLKAIDSVKRSPSKISFDAIEDSFNNKLDKLEINQQKAESATKISLLFIALFTIAVVAGILLFFQFKKIKEQKRYVEDLHKELHHRIRNNLGIIAALIDASDTTGNRASSVKDLENRIQSISLVHEQLYQHDDVTKLHLQEFLEKIGDNVINAYKKDAHVKYTVDASLIIETKLATQLALVIVELITNSLKHGINGQEILQIHISAKLLENKKIAITYNDNGIGFPKDFDAAKSTGYGLQMINGLIKQMQGKITYSNNNGAYVEFIF